MARPRKFQQTPEQAERQGRFEDAMRWAGMTWTQFCERHGFVMESIWRWVRNGDPTRPPLNGGKVHSSDAFARALDLDPGYFRPGGPRLMIASPAPYPGGNAA